jgi:type IV secretion system protein VirD4
VSKQDRKRAATPKPPSKARQASDDKVQKAAKAMLPYAAGLGASVAAAAVTRDPGVAFYGAGVVSGVGGLRGWDAIEWHRAGGKAAARRRRKFQGTATTAEIHRTLSERAARRRARTVRPSLEGRTLLPRAETGIEIGRGGKIPRTLMGGFEHFYAIFGIARYGKSGALARIMHDYPGAALSTSTRTDMWANTVYARRELAEAHNGRLLVLNPGGDGLIPSDFEWNPLTGCHTFPRACDAAGHLMGTAPKDPGGSDAWIDDRGAQLLRVMMHAAAIAGGDMMTVREWCRHPASRDPMSVLGSSRADPQAARSLAALLDASKGTFLQSVITTAESALSWLDDPVMRRAACPPDGTGLDVWDFLETCGTVYLVGKDKRYNALTAYFRCFAGHLFDRAKQHASVLPGGRLDPPLGMVIDEPAITCRLDLDAMAAEAGGHGITVVTGFQSFAQLAAGWGDHGGRTVFDNAVKIVMGGYTASDELERISAACGERDTWHHVTAPDGSKTKQPAKERLFPPERIRSLRDSDGKRDPEALLLYRSTRPLVITVPPVWRKPGYRRAATGFDALAQAAGPKALETSKPREIEAPSGASEGSS